ncbi:hypothetical protein M0805_004839 [Coniferiporia weirii]|nr:hypothetical protein M0805_004839 [Coniferiporia weirii]
MSIYASSTAGIPYLILDLVIDTLIRDRRAIGIDAGEYGYSNSYFYGLCGCKTLWDMTLVHQTWTIFAPRGLWYRAVLNGRDLETARHDLIRCQQLRELAVVFDDDNANTQEGLPSSFLQQSINIKTLYIDVGDACKKEVENFLCQLSFQPKLERLWIMGAAQLCTGQICAAVSKMQNLKSLVLGCSVDDFADVWIPDGIDPPEKLRSVAILKPLDWLYVAWLLQPRGDSNVSELTISLEHDKQLEESSEFVSQFYECLPRLKSLHVSTTNATSYDAEYLQTYVLNSLLSKATSLQCFMLSVDKLDVTHLHLPESVTQLHIHRDLYTSDISDSYYRMELRTDDSSIKSILAGVSRSSSSSSPCRLNALVISVRKGGDLTACELDALSALFTRTHAICRDMQIALTFEARGSLYIGDVAEDPVFAD